MTAALDSSVRKVLDTPYRPGTVRLMTIGFLIYTLLILAGHLIGFPLGYAYLHTVCFDGCALTPGNVRALEQLGLSIPSYATLYTVIQVLYILVSIGIALLIVFKKPGQWVPLGMSAFLAGLSAYEGADYPALAAAYPVLYTPTQFLIGLGMGLRAVVGRGARDHTADLALFMDLPIGAAESRRRDQGRISFTSRRAIRRRPLPLAVNVSHLAQKLGRVRAI